MGTIISVYSRSAYKEFILPAADNTDYSVCLRSRDFHIERPVNIELEVLSGIWYIKDSDAYTVGGDEAEDGRYMLTSDKVIPVTDKAGDDFRIIAKKTLSAFTAFTKYSLSGRERVTIGRTPDNDICYDNLGLVSKRQASIERSSDSWNIYNYGKNGIYVDSKLVKDEAPLDYGESINIAGLRIVFLRDHIAVDESRDNVFVHPEMEKYHGLTEGLAAEARPAQGNRDAYPYREKEFSTNTKVQEEIYIEQPVIGVGGWKKTYQEYLIREEKKVHELTDSVRDMLLRKYPSSGECMDVNNGSSLWDRSISDDGVMTVRLGTGDTENPCKVTFDEGKLYLTDRGLYEKAEGIREKYRTLKNVPVTVDIGKYNVVRITAEDHRESSLTALMTAVQLAQHISPFDLRTAFIFDEQREDETNWEKARLLPHVWSEDLSSRYFARDRETAGETVYRLARVLLSREDLSDSEISALPRYVVFISDRKYAAGSLLEKYMMQKRYLGFTVVYISESDDLTGYPEELRIKKEKGGELSFISSEGVKTAAQDDFDQGMFEDYARRLASSGSRSKRGIAVIPDFVSLLGTYGVRSAEDLHIDVRWAKNRTYEHIRGVLGKGAGNMTRYLDLHERYNGPHVLIAGTTGSGKSELLQSFILSLAAEYSPEDINFILIDFKGGGMANALADLPHTSGCITNLSGGEAERAMLAVKCEILSRQRLLNDYGINHIDDYVRLYKNGEVKKPLPHLVITVDEFAELRKEKPGFMSELISVAQTGRSLGIHLVLATQRPRGNVDDDIRTNMHSVICLRVQDKNDSLDVIDRPDAAYITSAGRGYLEVGAGEVFEPF